MITHRSRIALMCLTAQLGCAPGQTTADPTSPAPAPAPAPAPEPAPPPAPAPEPAPPPEPLAAAPEPLDLATINTVHFKIVAILNPKDWVPCGILHSVGALEVEVLGAGEPPPHMILLVSCPADVRKVKLAVGETLTATLHHRKRPWPAVRDLPADLPRRQVASFSPSAP